MKANGFVACLVVSLVFPLNLFAKNNDCFCLGPTRVLNVETQQITPNQVVKVCGKKIVSVQSFAQGQPIQLKNCRHVPLSGGVLLPGLIDSHTHLFLDDRSFGTDFSGELRRMVGLSNAERMRLGRKNAREYLTSGFTTVRDLGNSGRGLDLQLKKEIEKGATQGPAIEMSGPGFSVGTGQFEEGLDPKVVSKEYQHLLLGDGLVENFRKYKQSGGRWIKVFADNDPTPSGPSQAQLLAFVKTAHDVGLRVAAHSTSLVSLFSAAQAFADSIEHGYAVDAATLSLMAKRGMVLVPTHFSEKLCLFLAKKRKNGVCGDPLSYQKEASARLKLANSLGVKIAFGADVYFDFSSIGLNRGEAAKESLYSYVEAGMTPSQALLSATKNAASLISGPVPRGKVEENYLADLIAVEGDPTSDIRSLNRVRFIMKNGKIISNSLSSSEDRK